YGDEIQGLRKVMEEDSAPAVAGGSVRKVDVLADYTKRIAGDIKLARPLKIVVDSGNGIAGASAPAIFRAIGCEVTELFSEVDGEFPNHHPDPSKPENLRDLINALQSGDAELGLACDGDGDRLGIVTKDGQNIFPDRQMMLFAQDVLSRVPGGKIIYDVKCSQRLAPAIEAAGGEAVIYKTGHSLIKAKAHFAAPAKLLSIDGIRVDWPDGFGLIRASNTTPVLVLRFEGHTQAALERIEHEMLALLKSVKPDAKLAAAAH
ncbi:MAG TPA: phosphomannomutase/phosphoglucomutase, partial [Ramlibacter sp.]